MSQHNKHIIKEQIFDTTKTVELKPFAMHTLTEAIYARVCQPLLNTILDRNRLLMQQQVKLDAYEAQRIEMATYIGQLEAQADGFRVKLDDINQNK